MVKIEQQGTQLHLSGNTYEHREKIKSLGGIWKPDLKSWVIEFWTEEDMSELKTLKKKRVCGWCREPGHFKPKCEKFKQHMAEEEMQKAAKRLANPGMYYKRFESLSSCKCQIVSRTIEAYDVTVEEPSTCWACRNFCCRNAVMCDVSDKFMDFSRMNYTCKFHGTYQERIHWEFMNDSSGT